MSKIFRKVDELGRVTIPRDFRKNLEIECGEYVSVEVNGNAIKITKNIDECCICASSDELNYSLFDRKLCKKCKEKIGRF